MYTYKHVNMVGSIFYFYSSSTRHTCEWNNFYELEFNLINIDINAIIFTVANTFSHACTWQK